MVRVLLGAAVTTLLGAILAVVVSFTALGGWTSAEALPPVTLGGTCIFSQTSNTLSLTAPCSPTSTIVIPANKILNGNGKLIDGSGLPSGSAVITTTAGSTTNQVLAAKINVPNWGTGILFNGPGGTIQGNTINLPNVDHQCNGGTAVRVNGGLVTVSGNTITGLGCESTGINGNHASLTATSNKVNGLGSDSDSAAIYSTGTGATVSLNTIHGVTWGVWLEDSPTSSVKGNNISMVESGVLIEADQANGSPVTIQTNTISSGFVGIELEAYCGRSINNSNVSKNVVTKEQVWHYRYSSKPNAGDLTYSKWGTGILLDGCPYPANSNIQSSTIQWNTLNNWNQGIFSTPIFTGGAPFTLVSFNTIVG